MATYYINEAAFTLPDGEFVDRTVHVLEKKLPGGDSLGVLVLRRRVEDGTTLREIVTKHLADDAKRLNGFTVLDTIETTLAGAPAIVVSARWRHAGKVLYQRQAHLAVDWTWMLFAVSGPLSDREACDEAFEGLAGSLAWRQG
jgi:hypothetical protein